MHAAGTSIGAALYFQHRVLKRLRSFHMRHVYYGPECSDCNIEEGLDEKGLEFHRPDNPDLIDRTARGIAAGKTVGWFQGPMEFGLPRPWHRSGPDDVEPSQPASRVSQRQGGGGFVGVSASE